MPGAPTYLKEMTEPAPQLGRRQDTKGARKHHMLLAQPGLLCRAFYPAKKELAIVACSDRRHA